MSFQYPQRTRKPVYDATAQMNPQVNEQASAPKARKWRFGLFDCFADYGLCAQTCCCSCVTYGETKAKLNDDQRCVGYSVLYYCFSCVGLGFVLGAANRNEMRVKHGIDGSGIEDFCTHLCCGCCALIQEHREADAIYPDDS